MAETLDKVIVNKITKARYNELVATGVITPIMIKEQVWLFTDDQFVSSADKNNWNAKANISDIPTKVSELQNDSGYITDANIPTKVSELRNDSGYITSADIPTNISSFYNDEGYITKITNSDVINALGYTPLNATQKGSNNGVAELDSSGKVPSSQLPSYVDDVLEYATKSSFPNPGEASKIYVALDTNLTYRWGGSGYVEISPSLALGETSDTAYRGDRGKIAYDHAMLPHAPANAEENIIDSISVNGVEQTPDANKNVNIEVPTKTSDLDNDSDFITGMTILSYGNSTWADFIDAYSKNKVVYCRASSNSNPATGSQNRLAFMAYLNNATNPTEVEFQYYRSVSSHSDSQQGDQVYVYKLNSSGTWSVIVRNTFSRVVAGTNMTSSYSNGTITLNANTPQLKTINNESIEGTGNISTKQVFVIDEPCTLEEPFDLNNRPAGIYFFRMEWIDYSSSPKKVYFTYNGGSDAITYGEFYADTYLVIPEDIPEYSVNTYGADDTLASWQVIRDFNNNLEVEHYYILYDPYMTTHCYFEYTSENILSIPTKTSDLTNDSGFIDTETDPIFSASPASEITSQDIANWNSKQDALVSGTNIKTINNQSILGSGNIDIQGGSSEHAGIVDLSSYTFPAVPVDGSGTTLYSSTAKALYDSCYNTYRATGRLPLFYTGKTGRSSYTEYNYSLIYPAFSPTIMENVQPNAEIQYDFYGQLSQRQASISNKPAYIGRVHLYFTVIYDENGEYSSIKSSPQFWRETVSVLAIGNTFAYTPTANYNPATKKYVDDKAATKQDALVSGTNIKTINGESILGSGDISIKKACKIISFYRVTGWTTQSTTDVDIPNATATVTTNGGNVLVTVTTALSVTGNMAFINLYVDDTLYGEVLCINAEIGYQSITASRLVTNLSKGEHTFALKIHVQNTSNVGTIRTYNTQQMVIQEL